MSAPSRAYLEPHECHSGCGREGYVSLRGNDTTFHSCVSHLREAKVKAKWVVR
jgi:hypothetical protein